MLPGSCLTDAVMRSAWMELAESTKIKLPNTERQLSALTTGLRDKKPQYYDQMSKCKMFSQQITDMKYCHGLTPAMDTCVPLLLLPPSGRGRIGKQVKLVC